MKLFLVVLAAGLVLAVSHAEGDCPVVCGKQNGGLECPNNQCCSEDGKCGWGEEHCGDYCQSGACHHNVKHRCGKKFGNRRCTNNYCCGGDGYCGLGMNYCSTWAGCQSGFCIYDSAKCSETNKCDRNQCCSPTGVCGVGLSYCGDGCKGGPCYLPPATIAASANESSLTSSSYYPVAASADAGSLQLTGPPTPPSPSPPSKCQNGCGSGNGGLECPDNQCCSKKGECGIKDDHCGIGCQSGPCQPSKKLRCGKKFGKRKCPNNYCCSIGGYCGVGAEFCSTNCPISEPRCEETGSNQCQVDYGVCYGTENIYAHGPVKSDLPCAGGWCHNNLCCSGYNLKCGLGLFYCDDKCLGGPCYLSSATLANTSTLQFASSALQES